MRVGRVPLDAVEATLGPLRMPASRQVESAVVVDEGTLFGVEEAEVLGCEEAAHERVVVVHTGGDDALQTTQGVRDDLQVAALRSDVPVLKLKRLLNLPRSMSLTSY